MKHVKLNVEGMHCGGCESIIENALASLDGIEQVSADYPTGSVDIRFDNDKTDLAEIQKTIEESGYSVVSQEQISDIPEQPRTRPMWLKLLFALIAVMATVAIMIAARKIISSIHPAGFEQPSQRQHNLPDWIDNRVALHWHVWWFCPQLYRTGCRRWSLFLAVSFALWYRKNIFLCHVRRLIRTTWFDNQHYPFYTRHHQPGGWRFFNLVWHEYAGYFCRTKTRPHQTAQEHDSVCHRTKKAFTQSLSHRFFLGLSAWLRAASGHVCHGRRQQRSIAGRKNSDLVWIGHPARPAQLWLYNPDFFSGRHPSFFPVIGRHSDFCRLNDV